MNCSTTANIQYQHFLAGNFGALVFMSTYIGFYGMGIIIYFTYQFMTDSQDNHVDEIPSNFFSTYHQIRHRQEIYSRN